MARNGKAHIIVKNTHKVNSKWLNSATKSLGITFDEVFKEITPNIHEVTKSSARTTRNVVSSLKRNKSNLNNIHREMSNNKYVKFAHDVYRNALSDIKAGNLNNQDRILESGTFGGGSDDFDSDYGFEDDDGFSFGDDGAENVNVNYINANSGVSDAMLNISNTISKQTEAQLKTQKATMDAYIAVSTASMGQMNQLGSEIINQLTNVNSNLAALVEYNNENMTKFIESSIAYYDRMGQKSTNDYEYYEEEKINASDIFKSKGGINLDRYKDYIKQQFSHAKDNSFLGAINSMLSEDTLTMLASNPVGFGTEFALKAMMPKIWKSSLESMDKTFGNLMANTVSKLGDWADERGTSRASQVKKLVGQIFGVKSENIETFGKAEISRDATPFDGETKHAITEVITKELRDQTSYLRIIAEKADKHAVSKMNKYREYWDWDSGAYIKKGDIDKNIANTIINEISSVFADSKFGDSILENLVRNQSNDKKRDAMEYAVNELFYEIERQNKQIDLNTLLDIIGKTGGSDDSKKQLSDYVKNLADKDPDSFNTVDPTRQLAKTAADNIKNNIIQDPTRYNLINSSFNGEDIDINEIIEKTLYKTNARPMLKGKIDVGEIEPELYGSDVARGLVSSFSNTVIGMMNGIMRGDSAVDVLDKFNGFLGEQTKIIGGKLSKWLFGEKDENGYSETGILKETNNSFRDLFNTFKWNITGKGFTNSKGEEIEDKEDSVFSNFKSIGADIKDGIMLKIFGKERDKDGKYVSVENTKGIIGHLSDTFKEGWKGWTSAFFGNDDEPDNEEIINENKKKISDYFKKALPDSMTGAVIGAGAGLAIGNSVLGHLVGGPIGGAVLGTATGFIARSEKFQNFLFGEKDENGERMGGIISKKTQDFFKEHKNFLVGSAAVGSVSGLITGGGVLGSLVGGPVAGAILGTATGIISKSKIMDRFLHGDDETGKKGLFDIVSEGFNKFKDRASEGIENGTAKRAGMHMLGMAGGAVTAGLLSKVGILGAAMTPLGPIGGALVGLGLSIKAQAGGFKKWLFGEEDGLDINGKKAKKQGVLGKFGNFMNAHYLRPLMTNLRSFTEEFGIRVEHDILSPFLFLTETVTNRFGRIIDKINSNIKDGLGFITGTAKNIINKAFLPIGEAVGKITDGAAKLASRVTLDLVSLPGNLIKLGIKSLKITDKLKKVGNSVAKILKNANHMIMGGIKGIFKLAAKGVGTIIKGATWIPRTFFKVAGNGIHGLASKLAEKVGDSKFFNRANKLSGSKSDSLFDRIKRDQLVKKEKLKEVGKRKAEAERHDRNAQFIAKYTNEQFSVDTEEAREYLLKVNPKKYYELITGKSEGKGWTKGKENKSIDQDREDARIEKEGRDAAGLSSEELGKTNPNKLNTISRILYNVQGIFNWTRHKDIEGNDSKDEKDNLTPFEKAERAEVSKLKKIWKKQKNAGIIDKDVTFKEFKEGIDSGLYDRDASLATLDVIANGSATANKNSAKDTWQEAKSNLARFWRGDKNKVYRDEQGNTYHLKSNGKYQVKDPNQKDIVEISKNKLPKDLELITEKNIFGKIKDATKNEWDSYLDGFTSSNLKKMDKKAEGGISEGGPTIVGEEGPEIVRLSKGAEVISNGVSKAALASISNKGKDRLNKAIDDAKTAEELKREKERIRLEKRNDEILATLKENVKTAKDHSVQWLKTFGKKGIITSLLLLGGGWLIKKFPGIITGIKKVVDTVGPIISTIGDTISGVIGKLGDGTKEDGETASERISQNIENAKDGRFIRDENGDWTNQSGSHVRFLGKRISNFIGRNNKSRLLNSKWTRREKALYRGAANVGGKIKDAGSFIGGNIGKLGDNKLHKEYIKIMKNGNPEDIMSFVQTYGDDAIMDTSIGARTSKAAKALSTKVKGTRIGQTVSNALSKGKGVKAVVESVGDEAVEKVASKAGTVAKEAAEAVVENSSKKGGLLSKVLKIFKKFLEDIPGKAAKLFKGKKFPLSKLLGKIKLDDLLSVIKAKFPKISAKVSAKLAGGGAAAAATAGISELAFVALGAIDGASGAAKLFHVNKDAVDGKMRTIATIFGGLSGTTVGGVIDIIIQLLYDITGFDLLNVIATSIYKLISGDDADKKLEAAQNENHSAYLDYKDKKIEDQYETQKKAGLIGDDVSLEEFKDGIKSGKYKADFKSYANYQADENGAFSDKIGKGFSKAGKGIKKGFKALFGGKNKIYKDENGNTYTKTDDGTFSVTDSNGQKLGYISEDALPKDAVLTGERSEGLVQKGAKAYVKYSVKSTKAVLDVIKKGAKVYTVGRKKSLELAQNVLSTGATIAEKANGFIKDVAKNGISGLFKPQVKKTTIYRPVEAALCYYKLSSDGKNYSYYDADGKLIADKAITAERMKYLRENNLVTEDVLEEKTDSKAQEAIKGIKSAISNLWQKTKTTVSEGIKDVGDVIFSGDSEKAKKFAGGMFGPWMSIFGKGGKGSGHRSAGGYGPDTLNGHSYFSQSDSRWGNKAYNTGNDNATFADTGCGPTAMAMVASDMHGNKINPRTMGELAKMTGDRDETGTNWNFINKASATLGMNSQQVMNPSASYIDDQLNNGNEVILSGTGHTDGKSDVPYTKNGHYVVAVGKDKSGNVIINDPRGKQYSGKYSLNKLANKTGSSWSFGGHGKKKAKNPEASGDVGKWIRIVRAVKKAIADKKVGYSQSNWIDITLDGKTIKCRTDCSGFVGTCLKFFGVADENTNFTSHTFNESHKAAKDTGFHYRVWSGWDDLMEGDIIANTNHVEIFYKNQNGQHYVYNCGSSNSCNNPEPTVSGHSSYNVVWSPGNAGKDSVGGDYNAIGSAPEGSTVWERVKNFAGNFFGEFTNRAFSGLMTGDWSNTNYLSLLGNGNDGESTSDGSSNVDAKNMDKTQVANQVWNYFTKNGYSKAATAGIMGNLYQESKMNPRSIQGNGTGPAAGIAQWENYTTRSGRWNEMNKYAAKKGRHWTNLGSQLEFIDKELKNLDYYFKTDVKYGNGIPGGTLSNAGAEKTSFLKFKDSNDVDMATRQFEGAFERAGKPMMENRISAAKGYYKTYAGGGNGTGPSITKHKYANNGGYGPKKSKSVHKVNYKSHGNNIKRISESDFINVTESSVTGDMLYNIIEILASIATNTSISNDKLDNLKYLKKFNNNSKSGVISNGNTSTSNARKTNRSKALKSATYGNSDDYNGNTDIAKQIALGGY